MRAEKDSIRMGLKDLGDQHLAEYALVFYVPSPSGSPMAPPAMHVVHVDMVEQNEEIVSGFLSRSPHETLEVIRFPVDYTWYLAHLSIVEEVSFQEILEKERSNVSYRVQMQKDLNAVHEAAAGGDYVPDPILNPTQPPRRFEPQQLDWLDKMGEQLDEEGPDERKS